MSEDREKQFAVGCGVALMFIVLGTALTTATVIFTLHLMGVI